MWFEQQGRLKKPGVSATGVVSTVQSQRARVGRKARILLSPFFDLTRWSYEGSRPVLVTCVPVLTQPAVTRFEDSLLVNRGNCTNSAPRFALGRRSGREARATRSQHSWIVPEEERSRAVNRPALLCRTDGPGQFVLCCCDIGHIPFKSTVAIVPSLVWDLMDPPNRLGVGLVRCCVPRSTQQRNP